MNVYVYTVRVVKVSSCGNISVYVYPEGGGRHHLPHCHVYWPDGSAIVALPTLMKIAGHELPPKAQILLCSRLEKICTQWDELNPGRMIECQ